VCSTCAIGGHTCSYDPSIKKRGLPEGYVRGLEKLWGLTIREAADVETTILSLLDRKDGIEALSRTWSDKDFEETLLDTWRKSRLCRELDTLLPLLEIADDKSVKRKRQDSSGTPMTGISVSDLGLLPPRSTQPANLATDQNRPLSKAPVHFQRSPIGIPAEKLTTIEPTELPDNAWELLDIYFSYTHCWLPIVEKHNLLRASYLYPACISSSTPGSGDHAALWAILAYAESHHAAITRGLTYMPSPLQEGPWMASELYKSARNLIPDEDGVFELGHVQALLLLTLLNMGQSRWKQAWLLIGQAVRVAIDLRLGDEADDGKSRNRHVYFGCFILDTLVAARLQRMAHLRMHDALQHGLLQEDGLDEWNPWVDCLGIRRNTNTGGGSRAPGAALSTFNRLLQISAVLNTIISDNSLGGAEHSRKCRTLLEKLELGSKPQEKSGATLLPQQYHADTLYAATCATIGIDQAENINSRRNSLVELLGNLRGDYGLVAVSPTFDCFLNIFIRQCGSDRGSVTSEDALNKLEEMLPEMAQSWPTFRDTLFELRKLRSSTFAPQLSATAYSQLRNSSTHFMTGKSNGFENSHKRTQSTLDETYGTPSSSSAYTPSGQAILEAAIQFDPSLLVTNTDIQQTTTSPWSLPVANPLAAGHSTAPQSNMKSAPQACYPAFGSQIDDDSMFNEFATLDAMKW